MYIILKNIKNTYIYRYVSQVPVFKNKFICDYNIRLQQAEWAIVKRELIEGEYDYHR